jgi:regulator of sigma E protease
MSLLIFIAILIALIWVHELGHFSAAKLFGIRVDEFAIGFPPRLLRVRWGETDYTFNLLLVGGFVRIHGEDPGTSAHDKRSMAGRHRLVQATVISAGIIMNLLFGWLVLSAGYMAGMTSQIGAHDMQYYSDTGVKIVYVLPDSPAAKAGLKEGDTITRVITGTAESSVIEPAVGSGGASVQEFIEQRADESFIFSLRRADETVNILVRAEEGIVEGKKAVGIQMADIGTLTLPPHLALVQGAQSAVDLTVSTAQGLTAFFGKLFTGKAEWSEVAGPVGIAGVGAGAVEDGFAAAAFITALISINLAIINILPIPGLDGGRLLIIAVEAVIRRPLSQNLVAGLSLAGFALVITLMLAVTYHDIARLIG